MVRSSFLILVVGVLLMSACSDDDAITSGDGKGRLIIRMTDSPASYDSVVIYVDSIRVHVSTSDTTAGWVTVSTTPAVYNLLDYVNGQDTVIGNATVPVGTYSQLRLHIGPGSYVVVNGVQHPLTIPSGMQSGLKLNIHATILSDITYTLMLDFDAGRSIVVTGNGEYILKPVIRVLTTTLTGNISGVVSPASAAPMVWAYTATDTSGTMADTSGAFRILYLPATTYTVSIFPTDTMYRDTSISGVIVIAGATTELDTIFLTPE